MTSLLAASRKHFAATLGLHTRTEPVCFSAAAFPRLKCTLWQDTPPCFSMRPWKIPWAIPRAARKAGRRHIPRWLRDSLRQANCRTTGSFRNLLVYLSRARRVKKRAGMVMGRRKVIHPEACANEVPGETPAGEMQPDLFPVPRSHLLLACDVFVAPNFKDWIRKQFVILGAAIIYQKFFFVLRHRYTVKNVQGDPSRDERIKVSVDLWAVLRSLFRRSCPRLFSTFCGLCW